jgi:hypothetical protein
MVAVAFPALLSQLEYCKQLMIMLDEMVWTCSREVLGLNLGQHTSHPHCWYSWFSPVLLGQYRDDY